MSQKPRVSDPSRPDATSPGDPSESSPGGGVEPGHTAPDPIPMLTEVVQVKPYDNLRLPVELSDADWVRLANRVRENVLERLLRHSDSMLDGQLRAALDPAFDRAVDVLRTEMHERVEPMLRDVVARAISDELSRVHAAMNRKHRTRSSSGRS